MEGPIVAVDDTTVTEGVAMEVDPAVPGPQAGFATPAVSTAPVNPDGWALDARGKLRDIPAEEFDHSPTSGEAILNFDLFINSEAVDGSPDVNKSAD